MALQLQLLQHHTTLHPAVVAIATTPKTHTSNHLSVHLWIRPATRDSQQPTSPIGVLSLKLLPPPCAVLLVFMWLYVKTIFQDFAYEVRG